MEEHPNLCSVGYPTGWSSSDLPKLPDWRASLAADIEQFEKARTWIAEHLEQRKRINMYCGSYTLKHVCERHIGYVMNGTFIAAMIANGFALHFNSSLNPYFNVTTTSIKRANLTSP